jgi:hypothetical protein
MKNKNNVKLETSLELLRRKNDWFQKVMKNATVKGYLKEAKKVGYIVTKEGDFSFDVNDDETGEIVFCGVALNAAFNVVMFNRKYWVDEIQNEDPIIHVSADDLEKACAS